MRSSALHCNVFVNVHFIFASCPVPMLLHLVILLCVHPHPLICYYPLLCHTMPHWGSLAWTPFDRWPPIIWYDNWSHGVRIGSPGDLRRRAWDDSCKGRSDPVAKIITPLVVVVRGLTAHLNRGGELIKSSSKWSWQGQALYDNARHASCWNMPLSGRAATRVATDRYISRHIIKGHDPLSHLSRPYIYEP